MEEEFLRKKAGHQEQGVTRRHFFFPTVKVLLKQLIYNVAVTPAVPQSDSVIYVHTAILFQVPFPHSLSQNRG